MDYSIQALASNRLHAEYFSESDLELITRVRSGNSAAFEPIMRRYNQRLFRLSRSLCKNDSDAMDILQDSYVVAYEKLAQFSGPDGFVGWLSRIVRNEALMRIRRNKLVDICSIQDHEPLSLNKEGPSEILAQGQLTTIIEQAIDQLPDGYASVFVMRGVQQLTTQETAISLDLEIDVVKKRYSRAKKKLRQQLELHIQAAGLDVFEFAGEHCDAVVSNVLARINQR
ncbi:RNA polymerase sigma factor [Amphritea japonica]|uniref:RNA polymerase sigma-70 factor, ECF subfamily n=1 Tax=Amphritea japonica ATCC BAA-1530 TaxID=1278309 RepID=A0A7R6PKH7_9GAMM|nr:RNA polymerase sigma factor [Amphritea japonica]BBB26030.1 RNA polymerase sigma-70 factor, ECF subfamily [Amphritea japonica ATCC BAA-1530]